MGETRSAGVHRFEMTSIQIDLPSVQRERLQVVANRIGMDLNELVLEGIDRTLRSYEM